MPRIDSIIACTVNGATAYINMEGKQPLFGYGKRPENMLIL